MLGAHYAGARIIGELLPREQAMADVVVRTLDAVTSAADPEGAARALLQGCIDLAQADRGRLYLLELSSGLYNGYVQIGRRERKASVGPPDREARYSDLPPLERALRTRQPQVIEQASPPDAGGEFGYYASRVIVPLIRGRRTCLGLLDLASDTPAAFKIDNDALTDTLRPMLRLAAFIYDWRSRRKLLEEAQQPVRYNLPESDFYDEVLSLIALASQMEHIAIYELVDTTSLQCIARYGDSGPSSGEDIDVIDSSTIPDLAKVISTHVPFASGSSTVDSDGLAAPGTPLPDAQSFILCPVLVGQDLFGVLYFGTDIDYEFTYDEVAGFQSIANGIGISIANYRHFHSTMLSVATYQDVGTAITAVEVAQAARHEGRAILDDAVTELVTLRQEIGRGAKSAGPLDSIDIIDRKLDDLSGVLDKIKVASKTPSRDRSSCTLREIWDQARSQVSGRLTVARVESVSYEGPDVGINVAPDWFRQIFINLLLNSADAFSLNAVTRRHRRIRFIVDKPNDKTAEYVSTYIDNAGGINHSGLRALNGSPIVEPLEQAIFIPNVTSKPDGSGWGLALVRRILKDHGGSIDLIDHRGGVTFRIRIPKPSSTDR